MELLNFSYTENVYQRNLREKKTYAFKYSITEASNKSLQYQKHQFQSINS